jgi:hypothetical protein
VHFFSYPVASDVYAGNMSKHHQDNYQLTALPSSTANKSIAKQFVFLSMFSKNLNPNNVNRRKLGLEEKIKIREKDKVLKRS